ncbi:TPA: phage tail protein [Aeromonas veronii]
MANFFAILTNAGAAKLANAAALGIPLKLTTMAVGDGNGQAVTPNPAATKLVNEKRRAPLNALFADPLNTSQLVAEQIIPETIGGWWIRELGLYDETGTLIAVANCPDTYKPLLSEGSGRTQVIRMVLIVSNTSAVELKIDPAVVLATRKYVDDLLADHKKSSDHPDASETAKGFTSYATQVQTDAGAADNVVVTPKKLLSGMIVQLGTAGYIRFPTWMKGFTIQWGSVLSSMSGPVRVAFPLAFSSEPRFLAMFLYGGTTGIPVILGGVANQTATGFDANAYLVEKTRASVTSFWISFGFI